MLFRKSSTQTLAGLSLTLSLLAASSAAADAEPDSYRLVRGWLGTSQDTHAKALCEQHIAIVEAGLPDPEGGADASLSARSDLLKNLYLGARSSNDPSVALAHVIVLLGMLEGDSYVAALDRLVALEAQQVPRAYDCTRNYEVQALASKLTVAATDPELQKDRMRYLVACGEERPAEENHEESSWAMEQLLSNIETAYGVSLVDNGRKLGASSGSSAEPPRYVATYRDAKGNLHRQPLTDGFITGATRAYTHNELRKETIDGVNKAAEIWNGVISVASTRFPGAGIANVPSASVLGTVTAAIDNLSAAAHLGGHTAPGLAAVARYAGWLGLAIALVEDDTAVTAKQEKAHSLDALRPGRGDGGRAEPMDVARSEQVLSENQGTKVKIEPAPKDEPLPKFDPDTAPNMCPVGPSPTPFDPEKGFVECDAMPGSTPLVPRSCQRAMDAAAKEIHDGYEWSQDGFDIPLRPFGEAEGVVTCDDTGRNPSRCLEPEPGQIPISGELDGNHYTQESEEALGNIGPLLDKAGKDIPLIKIPDVPKLPPGFRLPGGSLRP